MQLFLEIIRITCVISSSNCSDLKVKHLALYKIHFHDHEYIRNRLDPNPALCERFKKFNLLTDKTRKGINVNDLLDFMKALHRPSNFPGLV